jgi:hypothetical protein
MAFGTRDGQGALFANDLKETAQQPDYTGNVRIAGVLYRLAGWQREARSGRSWLSLKAQPDNAEGSGQEAPLPAQAATAARRRN